MNEDKSKLETLQNLLDYEVGKFTNIEVQLINILPDWTNKVNSLKLKAVMQKYQDLVKQHIEKIESFFEDEQINSFSINNHVLKAMIEETEETLSLCSDRDIKDACMLAYIQKINHFKISTYGTAAAFANTLGMQKYASIFHEIEVSEKQIDDRLSQLAEYEINKKAHDPNGLLN